MTDNELLLAISNIVESKVEPLRLDIVSLKEDVAVLKEDVAVLKEDVAVLKEDVAVLKEDVAILKEDVTVLKKDVTVLKLIHENDVQPRLQNIEGCYLATFERYQSGINQIDTMQMDIDVMKGVIAEHSEMLQKLA